VVADRRRVALAVVLSVVVTAGCGVAETRRPVDLGEAAVAGSFGGGGVKEPAPPESATDPRNLVELYLKAGIGDAEKAAERVRRFFVPDSTWQPTPSLTIVRLIGAPSPTLQVSGYLVTVQMQRIGTLSPTTGAVELRADQRPETARFTVVRQETQWRLKTAPPGLILSDIALEEMYQPSPVYFWNLERTRLVPDLRYVPLNLPVAERLNQVVEWQLVGPSNWLRDAVVFKVGVKLKERVVASADGVVVNLSSGAESDDPKDLQRLTDQLRWTLRAHVERPVELRIEGQKKNVDGSGGGYLTANAAAVDRPAALFAVDPDKQRVVPRNGLKAPRLLSHKANENVSLAGISAEPYNVVAFVGANQAKLTAVRIGTSEQDQGKITEAEVGLPAPIGRPVWIPEWGQDRRDQFLVPAGGRLYVVDARGRRALLPLSVPGAVRSVSVSQDGRRVALAVGGRAFVGALAVDRGSVQVGSELRELAARRVAVAAVAWASESKVLVAGSTGSSDRAALFRVSADGAVAIDDSPAEVALTDVIAFPDRTGGSSGAGDIVAQTENAVFYVFSTTVEEAPDLVRPFYAG
jgi:hypothetical protein